MNKYQKTFGVSTYLSDDLDGAPLKIGTRVRKTNSQEGDIVKNGSQGKIIGSISEEIKIADDMRGQYLYSVVWDVMKNIAVNVIGEKLEIISEGEEKEKPTIEEILNANSIVGKRLTENGEVTPYKKKLAISLRDGSNNFDGLVFVLMSKAQLTKENQIKLKNCFPEHFELWWEWFYCRDEEEFFKKYGVEND